MNKLFFIAGLIAVLINVTLGSHHNPSLAAFGLGLIFVVSFNWIYRRMAL